MAVMMSLRAISVIAALIVTVTNASKNFPIYDVPPVDDDWFGYQLTERDDRFNAFLSHIQVRYIHHLSYPVLL
jgi:hypothetical protein